jgi:hypothetical protein
VVHGTWSGACPFTRRFSRLAATVSGPENGRTFARILEPCARASGHDNMDLHCSLISNDSDVELLDCLRRGEEAWAFLTVHEVVYRYAGTLKEGGLVCNLGLRAKSL